MVFHLSLSNRKFSQESRTIISILADLSNPVVWMVSIIPLISKSSSPFINPSVTVPRAPITFRINVTFIRNVMGALGTVHNFFQFSSEVEVFILLFTSLNFILESAGTAKSTILQVHFLWIIIRAGRLAEIT